MSGLYPTSGTPNLIELLPEFYGNQKLWEILVSEFIDTHNKEFIVDPIRQLEHIRWLREYPIQNPETKIFDEDLLNSTAKMLGFNLSYDIYQSIKDRFIPLVSQLSLYHHTNGVGNKAIYKDSNNKDIDKSFTSFLSFILGADVSYRELYSNSTDMVNYKDLVEDIPAGSIERLNQDSIVSKNTWFKTTHINVSIDVTALQNSLGSLSRSGYTFIERLKQLLYAYMPINLVIHRIFLGYYFNANLKLAAGIAERKYRLYSLGLYDPIIGVLISGPTTVYENSTNSYFLWVLYDDRPSRAFNADVWWTERPEVLGIDSHGTAKASTITTDVTLKIHAIWGMFVVDHTVTVLNISGPQVANVSISGPNEIVESNTVWEYKLNASLTTGVSSVVTDTANTVWGVVNFISSQGTWSVDANNTLGLTINNIAGTKLYIITARYTDQYGIEHFTTYNVSCASVKDTDLSGMEIRGVGDTAPLTTIHTDEVNQYEAYVSNYAGLRYQITPIWFLSVRGQLTVDNQGRVSPIDDINYSSTSELVASFEYNQRKVSASLQISAIPEYITPVSVEIIGYGANTPSDVLSEKTSYQYKALVEWSNGYKTPSPAVWHSSKFTIDKDAGILTTGIIDEEVGITLQADVLFEGLTVTQDYIPPDNTFIDNTGLPLLSGTASLVIKPSRENAYSITLEVRGANTLSTPNNIKLYSYMLKSDGKSYPIECAWTAYEIGTNNVLPHVLIAPYSDTVTEIYYATIAINSGMYANAKLHPIIEIEASYTDSVETYTYRHIVYVFVTDAAYTKIIDRLEIIGPDYMAANSREQYVAVLYYKDLSTKQVTGQWYLVLPEEEDQYVVAYQNKGLVTARSVRGDTAITLRAKHYTQRAEKTIIIRDTYNNIVDIVDCTFLEGPKTLCIGDQETFSLMVHWNGDPNPTRESADWTLNDYTYASIDGDGTLMALNRFMPPLDAQLNSDGNPYVEIVVTAHYDCGSVAPIERSEVIQLIWCEGEDTIIEESKPTECKGIGVLTNLTIQGPSSVEEESTTPYILIGTFVYEDEYTGTRSVNDNQVEADFWDLDDFTYANIDINGNLIAGEIPSQQSVKISACYTDQASQITVCDTHDVTIRSVLGIHALAMEIVGSPTIYEGETESFRVKVEYSDRTIVFEPTDGWSIFEPAIPPSYVQTQIVNGTYNIIVGDMGGHPNANIMIQATWTDLETSTTFTDQHLVTLIKNVSVLRPCWGFGPYGGGDEAFVTLYCTNQFPEVSHFTFTTPEDVDGYLYFCSPKSLGKVQFYFSNESGVFLEGGMDGATWPDNDVSHTVDPITIGRTANDITSDWYLYRSDWKNLGSYTVKVVYENA